MNLRTLSIDPGTLYGGLTVMDTLITEKGIESHDILDCRLFDSAPSSVEYFPNKEFIQLNKYTRFTGLVKELIDTYNPRTIIYESPYVGTNVNSYKRLVELMTHVKSLVYSSYPSIEFIEIDPTSVKRKMGVFDGEKEYMKQALMDYSRQVSIKPLDFNDLNFDQIDSICIALWYLRSLFVSSNLQ